MNPGKHPHEPYLLDEVIHAIRSIPVPPCPADDDWVARTFSGPSSESESPPYSRRNLLVRIVPLSAIAAALVSVGLTAVFTAPASLALGDVIRAAKQHKLVKYRVVASFQTSTGGAIMPSIMEAYADLTGPRYRTANLSPRVMKGIEQEVITVKDGTKGVLMRRVTRTVTEKGLTDPKVLKLMEQFDKTLIPRKFVSLMDFDADPTPETGDKTKSILENLRELEKHKDAVATRSKFRGKDILRYRIEDGPRTTALVVDAATMLPVRLEQEFTVPKESIDANQPFGGIIKVVYLMSDFEWDSPLKGFKDFDELFSTEPPAGYEVKDLRVSRPKEKAAT